MKFIKQPLSILERLRWVRSSLDWLTIVWIDSYDHDDEKWYVRYFPFSERFKTFWAGFETALLGYCYGMKDGNG